MGKMKQLYCSIEEIRNPFKRFWVSLQIRLWLNNKIKWRNLSHEAKLITCCYEDDMLSNECDAYANRNEWEPL